MADLIKVRSKLPVERDGGSKVALSEYDEAHPGDGWAFVAGPEPVEVAETSGVLAALRDERIERVGARGKADKE